MAARTKKPLPRPLRVAFVFDPGKSHSRAAVAGMYDYIDRHARWEVVHIVAGAQAIFDLETFTWLDGFIAAGWPSADALMKVGQPSWKRVLIHCDPHHGANIVTVDEQAMAAMAVDEFQNMSLPRVAFYSSKPTPRGIAFIEEAQRRGIEASIFHQPQPFEKFWRRRHDIAAEWLAQLPKPIGIFTHAPDAAQLLTAAAVQANVHIPEQVAVLTCEASVETCMLSRPTLSCIAGNEERIGFEAARMLDDLFHGKPANGPIVIGPTEVQRRGSTDILAVADSDLASAIRLLRSGATAGQSIDAIVRQVPLSRNQLERGMRRVLGRSPHEEVIRIRLETATRMLTQTSLSTAEIAEHCGFGDSSNFCKIFKRNMGISPRQFRLK